MFTEDTAFGNKLNQERKVVRGRVAKFFITDHTSSFVKASPLGPALDSHGVSCFVITW